MPTIRSPLAVLAASVPPRLSLIARALPARIALLTRAVPPRDARGLFLAIMRCALAAVRRLVAPSRCAACDAAVPPEAPFCAGCEATIRPAAALAVGDGVALDVAFAVYGGALAKAVRRFKYGGRADLARPLGELLRSTVERAGLHADLVVPVPLHPRKLRERGYSQTALLASIVARAAGARLVPRGLVRTRDTPPQASLGRSERRTNLEGAFRSRRPDALRGAHVLLVDDVATTGSTLRACRDALLAAGARRVSTLVLARADTSEHAATSVLAHADTPALVQADTRAIARADASHHSA